MNRPRLKVFLEKGSGNRGPRMLISELSLSQTVDGINATYFEGRALAAVERRWAALWIAARQGLPGSYAGTFAGFPSERSTGIVLFTGERVASASGRHILGDEASRGCGCCVAGSRRHSRARSGR